MRRRFAPTLKGSSGLRQIQAFPKRRRFPILDREGYLESGLTFRQPQGEKILTNSEIVRVQQYLRDTFGNDGLRLVARKPADGTAEVFVADEFIGVIFRDDDEGEVSYAFNMAILYEDLPSGTGVP